MEAIHAFVAPPPISPLFQEGGVFYGLNEDITLTAIFLVVLFVVDQALVVRYLHPKSRYFALHAFSNALTAYFALPDLIKTLRDPNYAFSGPTNTMLANSSVASIHLYHCLAFKLPLADIVHHAVFCVVLCGLAIPYKQVGGAANNLGCFFLSGLPGGMDYVLLVLVREGYMEKLTEKKWNSVINTWLRGPSMAMYAFVAWQTYIYVDPPQFPLFILFIVGMLHFVNGQYYAEQAIGNFHRWSALDEVEAKSKSK
eukprot:m.22339 g.22339  ORF g.22339 m.22339 type:complete len:255 (-) comp3994_c0_seq1:97-861(-)